MKKCFRCKKTKDLSEFCLNRNSGCKATHQSWCKKCHSENTVQWRKTWLVKNGLTYTEFNRMRRFGVKPEEYIAMLAEQGGVCAICGKPETVKDSRTRKPFSLAVDHCHGTGKVRGLLCQNCNLALGYLRDDLDILASATSYLINASEL